MKSVKDIWVPRKLRSREGEECRSDLAINMAGMRKVRHQVEELKGERKLIGMTITGGSNEPGKLGKSGKGEEAGDVVDGYLMSGIGLVCVVEST